MKPLLIFLLSALIPSAFSMAIEASIPFEVGLVAQKALVIFVLLTATLAVVIATLENVAARAAALNDLETNAELTTTTETITSSPAGNTKKWAFKLMGD